MGGPYERQPETLEDEVAALRPMIDEKTVLVTHYPARGILDGGSHSGGLECLRRLVDEHDFLIHVHGHIHRTFGRSGRHFNLSSAGERRAFLIELPSARHRVLAEGSAGATELRQ